MGTSRASDLSMNSSKLLANALPLVFGAFAIAACGAPARDDGGAAESTDGLTTETTETTETDQPGTALQCTNGGSLKQSTANACNVGVKSAGCTTPTYTNMGWSYFDKSYSIECLTTANCDFNTEDGTKCAAEPDPANTYCTKNFNGWQGGKQYYWARSATKEGAGQACLDALPTMKDYCTKTCQGQADGKANSTSRTLTCCTVPAVVKPPVVAPPVVAPPVIVPAPLDAGAP